MGDLPSWDEIEIMVKDLKNDIAKNEIKLEELRKLTQKRIETSKELDEFLKSHNF